MIPLADDNMQVRLPVRLGVPDALLQHALGLLDVLPVQVQRVVRHALDRVVLAEDEVRGLLVVLLARRLVLLAGFGKRVRFGLVA